MEDSIKNRILLNEQLADNAHVLHDDSRANVPGRLEVLHLTQQSKGAVIAVSCEQIAAISRERVHDPIKCVNVVSPKKTAPVTDGCDACCECRD